nr:AMP-binding protein [Halobellus ruber]
MRRLRENVREVVKNSYAATVMQNAQLTAENVESVGKPVPGVQVRIVDRNGGSEGAKPPGEAGEIAVRAPDCPVWAKKRTDKTGEMFEDGWWYYGDLGYTDESGFASLQGRTDLMIISKWIKIYPSPVEEVFNAHPDLNKSAIVGVDDEYGEKVTADVHSPNPDLTAGELDQWCLDSDETARMERPREYRFVDESLPRTSTGALDRLGAKNEDPQ